jgi:type I restriction enzyme, S subunit
MVTAARDNPLNVVLEETPGGVLRPALTFSVDSEWVRNSNGLRFDAAHYNPQIAKAIALLRASDMKLRPLGEVTERVFIPGRFKRVYVKKSHGVPFVQGSHIVHFQPADMKYISPAVHRHLDQWIIRENWILVTRSGTVGRVAITPKSWDGWAASEHLLRIVPRNGDECPPGYLHAFLQSFAGQSQLTSHIYGAVVDELTEDQARGILVPIARTAKQRDAVKRINDMGMEAVRQKETAVGAVLATNDQLGNLLGTSDKD